MEVAVYRNLNKGMTFEKLLREDIPWWVETDFQMDYDAVHMSDGQTVFDSVRGLPTLVHFTVIHADIDDHLDLIQRLKNANGHGVAYTGFDSEDTSCDIEEDGFMIRFTACDIEVVAMSLDEDNGEATFYCSARVVADEADW